ESERGNKFTNFVDAAIAYDNQQAEVDTIHGVTLPNGAQSGQGGCGFLIGTRIVQYKISGY
ncbi:MAG: hypothetical protein F6K65_39005, partial [Moorea sp. SIO3C2]|nr:hypothetical protein [Moorena sp. SIO3C2]